MPAITFRYFFTSIFKHRHLCHSPRKALLIEFATNGSGSRSGSIAERPHAEEIIKFYTASNHPSITTLKPLVLNHKHLCHSPRKTLSTEFASKKLPGGDISWYGPKPHAAPRQSLETPSSHTDRLHMEVEQDSASIIWSPNKQRLCPNHTKEQALCELCMLQTEAYCELQEVKWPSLKLSDYLNCIPGFHVSRVRLIPNWYS